MLFGVSWVGTLPMLLASWRGPASVLPALEPLQLLMLFGPGLVACGVSAWEDGRAGIARLLALLLRWRVGVLWYVLALAGPGLLMLLALGVSQISGSTNVAWPTPSDVLFQFTSIFAVYFFLNTEEIAWRGYVLPRLQRRMSPLRATFLLGIVWAVFHLPLFLLRGGHPAGYPPLLFGALIIGLSMLFTAVFNHTGGSLLVVHVMHQAFNAWAEAIPVFPAAARGLTPIGIVAAAGCAIGLLALRWPILLSPADRLRRGREALR
jgi:membrane protease YdiL (CAAX protease family)